MEKNDVYAIFFSLISFLFILTAIVTDFYFNLAVGIGIIFYGIGYFLVHDVFYHKRIKISYKPKSKYLKRILNAHGIHHAMSTPKTGVNFGFLYANKKYKI